MFKSTYSPTYDEWRYYAPVRDKVAAVLACVALPIVGSIVALGF